MTLIIPTLENPVFPSPKSIVEELDTHCVGNGDYKYGLAHLLIEHLMRNSPHFAHGEAFPRTNLLVTGPTGSGKSHLLRCLEMVLGGLIPIIQIDCSVLTPSGYRGVDLEELLVSQWPDALRKNPNDYTTHAPIIYLDEFDKLSMKTCHEASWAHNKQAGILKLLEGGTISADKSTGSGSISTPRATVVLAGCFDDIVKYSKIDTKDASIGFHMKPRDTKAPLVVDRHRLVDFGFMPEIAGRITDVISLEKIPKDMYLEILMKPNVGILDKYVKLFRVYGIRLHITGATATRIAEEAYKSPLGIRSLNTELLKELKPHIRKLKQCVGYSTDVVEI